MAITDLQSIIDSLPFFKHNWKFALLNQSPFFVLLFICINTYPLHKQFGTVPLIENITQKKTCSIKEKKEKHSRISDITIENGEIVESIFFSPHVKIPFNSNAFANYRYFLKVTHDKIVVNTCTHPNIFGYPFYINQKIDTLIIHLDLTIARPNANRVFILKQMHQGDKFYTLGYGIQTNDNKLMWTASLLHYINFNDAPYFREMSLAGGVVYHYTKSKELKQITNANQTNTSASAHKKHFSFCSSYTVGGGCFLIAFLIGIYLLKSSLIS